MSAEQLTVKLDKIATPRRIPDEVHMGMIGIQAVAAIAFEQPDGSSIVEEIHSGGLWQIDPGSSEDYLVSVEAEEVSVLHAMLTALGVTGKSPLKQIAELAREDLELGECIDPADRVKARLDRIAELAEGGPNVAEVSSP